MSDRTKNQLLEEIDDLKVQLNAVTDELQVEREKKDAPDPSGGQGGAELLRSYCLFLGTLDPGLTVGDGYDFELSIAAAKEFWIAEGGNGAELD